MSLSKQIEAVLRLPAPGRYGHFIKQVADKEELWGLFDDGWAMVGDDNGTVFPVWHACEFAALCAADSWASFIPRVIDLTQFLEEMLPDLSDNNISVGVLMTPEGLAPVPGNNQLKMDLLTELSRYE